MLMSDSELPDAGLPLGLSRQRPPEDDATDAPPLAEDLSLPVLVEPGTDTATPPDWNWRRVDASQPNAAVFHISHSEVTRALVDKLGPSDSPPEANFRLQRELPIVVLDSLDKFWAGEARRALPLSGVRVPVEADSITEAKQSLAADLAAQLRLLLLLSNSRAEGLAPALRENLRLLARLFN